jgi:transposase-like protein
MSELASFSESSRQSTLQRFQLLRAHFEDGRSLAAIAREAKISYRTLQYWLERYRTSGLAALARKPRIDRGKCRKSTASLSRFLRASAVIFLCGGRPLKAIQWQRSWHAFCQGVDSEKKHLDNDNCRS